MFSSDAELLNVGDFADIIIEENQVGTTVKVDDDQKSDPYAVLSIINLNQQKVSLSNQRPLLFYMYGLLISNFIGKGRCKAIVYLSFKQMPQKERIGS